MQFMSQVLRHTRQALITDGHICEVCAVLFADGGPTATLAMTDRFTVSKPA